MQLTRTHRILIGVIIAGAAVIAAIGFVGSYAAVRDLAQDKGFGSFANVFPIGIDAGIVVLLALDLLLTWIRIPFPLLRQTAWLLTAATIAFNGAAAWPDPLGVGMHAVIPVLFVVAVEAARHAIGRIADITADRHMESVRVARWLLAPVPTFRLWRRMKLWELRSYNEVIRLEQDRLVYRARLRARFGRAWRRKAPVESLMPLRLARYGVPISQTAPAGLAAAGIVIPPEMALATGEAISGAAEPVAAIEAAGTVERADAAAKADAGAATAGGAGQRGRTSGATAPAALAPAADASKAPKASDEAHAAHAAQATRDARAGQDAPAAQDAPDAQGAPDARHGGAAKATGPGPGPVNGVSTRKNESGAAGPANGTDRANGSRAAAAPQAPAAPQATGAGEVARAAQATGAPSAAQPSATIPAPRAAHAGAHPEAGARPEAGAGREAAAASPATEPGREAGGGAGGPEAGVAAEGVGPDGGPVTVPVGSGGRRRALGNAQYVGYPAVAGGYADERPYTADPQASADPQAVAAAQAAAARRAERPAPYDDRHPDDRHPDQRQQPGQQSGHPHDQQRAGDGRRPDGAGDRARDAAARDQRDGRRPAQAPEFPPDATQEIALSALPELSTLPEDVPRDEAFYGAFRRFVTEHGAFPDSRQFSRYLLDHYGIAGVGGGPMPAHGLRREIRELRERYRMEMETEHIP
ncbi:DUF2637 domain-containing protein [Streptomyces sp. 71268]|uniref:DUF2637 domain-containing protein n=1 Tax=Streptomyces sp. 71268 TaxID=3002640 RepID=UPI0023F9AC5D|nr:DUF2637 domain-containing protein [Streptomyces sp. 71268]WEV29762.1 DUF2637 domain-containing protein [Streptomyces sp. 71268]